MKLARLISTTCDLSDAGLLVAWEEAGKPDRYSLIVGTEQAAAARLVKLNGKEPPWVSVNPEWTGEWMLSSTVISVFSERF